MCIQPVGEGAIRVTTGETDMGAPDGGGGAVRAGAGAAGPKRALIPVRFQLPSIAALARAARDQAAAQLDHLALWAPVAFGLGAAAYLGLKAEPSRIAAAAAVAAGAGLAAAAFAARRRRAVAAVLLLLALGAFGFAAAKLHSDAIATPIAPSGLGVVRVEGWVVDIASPSDKGERLVIAPVRIDGLAPAATPGRIRIIVPTPAGPESAPPPGSAIAVVTLLDPPPGPASPGAYDFARDAWFEGIGGVGLAMRDPAYVRLPPPPWRLGLEMAVNALRWRVAERLVRDISSVMGPDDGGAAGLAAAVTTSHQDWLGADHRDDLRGSGLAHMLAIAGLHTAAVSGFAFLFFRLAVAAWPWLAVRVNGKKVAAAAALAVVAGYLVLSGAHPPARRAAITAAVAFVAILADRRAISLHSLAVAAFLILLMEPDVVVQPGFEMSFCATASLVALAEIWPRRAPAIGLPWPLVVLQRGRDWLLALAVVSLVAGAATGPFAIQHFNRVANYGVFANLTADFLASAVLMPCLALTLLVQALGLPPPLATPVLLAAGWAAKGVVWLGHVFATAPHAAMAMSSAPEIALAVSYLGIVVACLWKGWLRWIGLPMAAAVALWPRPAAPVAWIASDGGDAAVVVGGEVTPMKPGTRAYALGVWAQRRGLTLPLDPEGAQGANFDCNRLACAPMGAVRLALAAWWTRRMPRPEKLASLCGGADILILRAPVAPPPACKAVTVLDRAAFAKGGSAEIFAAPGGWRIMWSQPLRGVRPWTVAR